SITVSEIIVFCCPQALNPTMDRAATTAVAFSSFFQTLFITSIYSPLVPLFVDYPTAISDIYVIPAHQYYCAFRTKLSNVTTAFSTARTRQIKKGRTYI